MYKCAISTNQQGTTLRFLAQVLVKDSFEKVGKFREADIAKINLIY